MKSTKKIVMVPLVVVFMVVILTNIASGWQLVKKTDLGAGDVVYVVKCDNTKNKIVMFRANSETYSVTSSDKWFFNLEEAAKFVCGE